MVADSEICLNWHGGRTRTVGEKWQRSCVLQGLPLKITALYGMPIDNLRLNMIGHSS